MSKSDHDIIGSTRLVVLIGLALLAFGVIGSATWWRLRLAHNVSEQLRALRAEGLPTSGMELNKWYASVPDSENAALVLTQAFALMRTYPDQRSNVVTRFKLPFRGQRVQADEVRVIADYVEMNAAALGKAAEGLILSKSRYPIDLSAGESTLLPHLRQLKTLAQAASFSVQLALESGQTTSADDSIKTILGLARTLDNEPLLLSQLVRAAILKIGVACLEQRLTSGQFNETELLTLTDAFRSSEKTNSMGRALIGERAIALPYFRMSYAEINRLTRNDEEGIEGTPGPPLPGPQPMFLRVTGLFERDLNFFLRVMQEGVSALSKPPPRSLGFTDSFEKSIVVASKKYYLLSGIFLSSLSRIAVKEAQVSARLRVATVAICIERFHLAKGRLPDDLRELVPGFLPRVPVDPFDGAPLRYRRLANGYVVYSVGLDDHDDGGKEPPVKRRGQAMPEDITFTVER